MTTSAHEPAHQDPSGNDLSNLAAQIPHEIVQLGIRDLEFVVHRESYGTAVISHVSNGGSRGPSAYEWHLTDVQRIKRPASQAPPPAGVVQAVFEELRTTHSAIQGMVVRG